MQPTDFDIKALEIAPKDRMNLRTEAHLLAYAHDIRNLVLEEAAEKCEAISAEMWAVYKGRSERPEDKKHAYDPHFQGMSDGASYCTAAIRELKLNQGETR